MSTPSPCQYLAAVGAHVVCRHEADRNEAAAHVIHGPEVCAACIIRTWPCNNPHPIPAEAEIAAALKPPEPEPEPSMPSALVRAKHFGAAMAGFAASGFAMSSPELKHSRLEICQACDQYRGGLCLKCGCLLAAKAAIRGEKCPLGKWPVVGVRGQLSVVSSREPRTTDHGPRTTGHWLPSVTFGITAFERPRHLERLVASILQFYPDACVVVADNGRQKAMLPPSVKVLDLPLDCGLSAARNALVDQLETPYLLLLEEDFVFTAETRIERFIDVLEHHPEVGCVGGSLAHGGNIQDYAIDTYVARGVLYGQKSTGQVRVTEAGTPYRLCDKIYNFGLWRRDMLADHRWPDELKLAEHTPYFWNVKLAARWLVAHCPSVWADHDQSGRSAEYQHHRLNFGQYVGMWYGMYGIGGYKQQKSLNNTYRQPDRPNLIVFGIGHSRTTILTQMIAACGWGTPDADETFCEHRKIRELNDGLLLRNRPLDLHKTTNMLQAMNSPWVVKDPRFVLTLEQWLPALSQIDHPPALLWIDRDLDELADSCQRWREIDADGKLTLPYQRGHTLASIRAEAERQFALYPWPKLHITGAQLLAAIALFKPPPVARMLVIPRIFHRIWLGGKPMPDEFARFGRGWVQMNPGWELRDWREDQIAELGELVTGDLWKQAKNFAQASDVLRYELLNRFGGVYLDTDFEALQPLEPALGGMSFVGAGEQPDMVSAGFIAAVSHHPILRDVLKLLPQRVAANLHQAQATGPGMLTQVWRRYHREPGVRTYAPSYFYPYGWKEKDRRWDKFPGAIAVHHWAGSWT